MNSEQLIKEWFNAWEKGDFLHLPISDDFKHTSPFGTIHGKKEYLSLVKENKNKFLGYRFKIHDGIYDKNSACVRYTGIQGDFQLDVSEWYYIKNGVISEIVAYYHIGDIRKDRELSNT